MSEPIERPGAFRIPPDGSIAIVPYTSEPQPTENDRIVANLTAKLAERDAEIEEMREVLKSVEWVEIPSINPEFKFCPGCNRVRHCSRHAADCRLAKVIGAK